MIIYTWTGGYRLHENIVDTDSLEGALEIICANVNGEFVRDFRTIDNLTEDEISEFESNYDSWLYIDATMNDGKCGYLCIENMKVIE